MHFISYPMWPTSYLKCPKCPKCPMCPYFITSCVPSLHLMCPSLYLMCPSLQQYIDFKAIFEHEGGLKSEF